MLGLTTTKRLRATEALLQRAYVAAEFDRVRLQASHRRERQLHRGLAHALHLLAGAARERTQAQTALRSLQPLLPVRRAR
ncbi:MULTISPECIES: hypothetical protein [Streptomyces]|uniref:CHAD domain-containing protein n=1 Tax=Streptomyces doudnae TaxID=3075536 RepID=A0ABD5ELZ7_9ACTN|nr:MULTISPECIES: hypothetical protein [unclassified Streptomyces]MDT0435676.1 hypothetical protein [Streptomyces sp. DSM 41981]MYQ62630.1 hypothetical protein [Streptomyces sp. SID4950]SCD41072.1 hypothetical protein GA0115242_1048136 [Streptomyces sp. SolWspMP-5a-2]